MKTNTSNDTNLSDLLTREKNTSFFAYCNPPRYFPSKAVSTKAQGQRQVGPILVPIAFGGSLAREVVGSLFL